MGDLGFNLSISIDGAALADDVLDCAVLVEFVESLDELDAFTVRFEVPPGSIAKKVLKLCKPGGAWVLELKTGEGKLTAKGDIIDTSVRLAPEGRWTVTLRGLEPLHRLRGAQVPKMWTGSPSSFLSTIASRHGLTAKAEGVDGNALLTLQAGEDDATFVKRLARDLNYIVSVEDKKLIFGRRNTPQGRKVTLEADEVQHVEVNVSLYDVVSKVTVVGHDHVKDEPVSASVTPSVLKKLSGGDDGPKLAKAKFGERAVVLANAACEVPSLAKALATAELQRAAETFVRGRIYTPARPTATAGKLVEVNGVPWPVSGPFLIRESRHVVENHVYRTELEFFSDTLPRPS